jgi:hypothetical protein
MDMETKMYANGMVKTVGKDGDGFDVEVVCSDEVVDRSDEVIVQGGWKLDRFAANPVFLAAHQHRLTDGHSAVIGSFPSHGVENAGDSGPALVGKILFADTELGREHKSLYRDGHQRAVSVGFKPIKGEYRNVKDSAGATKRVYFHTEAELIEVSAVAVGCNQNALARRDEEAASEKRILDLATRALDAIAEKQTARIEELILGLVDEVKALLPDYLKDAPACPPADRTCGAGEGDVDGGQAGQGKTDGDPLAAARKAMLDYANH